MKRNILLLFLLSVVFRSVAQETTVDPGQQARSYLDSKNMNVDHVTGTFYYKVPLHEMRRGNFTLPITLDYTARGVKADDKPGPVGYNWHLNTGGVVTRQLRGGIPDELPSGASRNLGNLSDYNQAFASVYGNGADGESDIFTAVFNGRSVSFVIRYQEDANPRIEAVPLELTNVRIKCLLSVSNSIMGWEITDEEGTKYRFEHEERCKTLREGTVETNVMSETHLSSWYLSSILPVGVPWITYEYHVGDSLLYQENHTRTTVKYWYGEPMRERSGDFSNYKYYFSREIECALSYFRFDNSIYYYERIQQNGLFNSLNDFYLNASLDKRTPLRILQNLRTMGMLYDMAYTSHTYEELINLLDRMVYECSSQGASHEAQQAIGHLRKAKDIVIECRDEVREIYRKDVYQFGYQEMETPMLKKIKCDNSVVEFKYNKHGSGNYSLDRVIVRDMNNDVIKSIRLTRGDSTRALPNEISFHDKAGEKVSNIKFDYYDFINENVVTNVYGYYQGFWGPFVGPEFENKQRFFYTYDGNAWYNLLKTIRVSSDAIIDLSYTCNRCDLVMNGNGVVYGQLQECIVGGSMIYNIKIEDKISGKIDDIFYDYHGGGTHVLPRLTNKLTINYPGGFNDILDFDRLYNLGPDAYVKLGNDGVYCGRVRESFKGKGSVVYDFVVPDRSSSMYNYWDIGHPLGKCFFDEEGRLRKVIRYEYDKESALASRKYLSQFKRCEYYVYGPLLVSKYQGDVYFEDNMRQRINPVYPKDESYRIAYDYSTPLKRVSEYYFEGEVVGWRDTAYLRASPCYTRTDFEYDLSRSTFPVKKTMTNSDGMKLIEVTKRALDFDDGADASIPLLKAENMVGIPLKVQTRVVDHAGNERLLTERVNIFGQVGDNLGARILLTDTYDYTADGTGVESPGSLFSFNRNKYDNTIIRYEGERGSYLPVSTELQGDRMEVRYDFISDKPILEVSLVSANTVAARDYRRFKNQSHAPEFKLSNAAPAGYRLLVLTSSSAAVKVSLAIKRSGVTSTREFTTKGGYLGPQVFDLDLTTMTGLEEISLPGVPGGLLYIALVPRDSEFKAVSYNADGTVYCEFDHNCQATRHEYDSAGRVVKTYDRDGKLLKENDYNLVIQN